MTGLRATGFPEAAVRARARDGVAAAFPPADAYGAELFGADPGAGGAAADELDRLRLVPPVFMPLRLEKLIDLGREPTHADVDLATTIGGLPSPVPLFLPAFGSTRVASTDLGLAASTQAGRLGVPMVVGENVMPVNGHRAGAAGRSTILDRVAAYADALPPGCGGIVVQQSTEDADAEVWNQVYTDPAAHALLESGRLAFELKLGQGAKPGLGGMTLVGAADRARLAGRYKVDALYGDDAGAVLRCSAPGTFTGEILAHQVRLMRNNYPRARVWVKLPPGRDVAEAAAAAWGAGADAVTVDGAEGGTGWAPSAFLAHVGLPLYECLSRIGPSSQGSLLACGRVWDGARAVKCLALGAAAVGLGRAALLAVDEDPDEGLVRLVSCLALEMRLLISALGKYSAGSVGPEDVWPPVGQPRQALVAAT